MHLRELGASAADFRRDRMEFVHAMHRAAGGTVPWPEDVFNPYPFVLDEREVERLMRLGNAVRAGIHAVVQNFARDERMQAIYALDERLVRVLERAHGRPYAIGMFRPDFVIDRDGEFRVCEINARFSANGYAINHIVDLALDGLPYLPNSIHRVEGMAKIHAAMTAAFRDGRPIAIVARSESGGEIHMLLDGFETFMIRPAELDRRDVHYVLELDRMELLELAPAMLEHIIDSGSRNDVRTLILVHDKRLLAVLSNESIMRDHVDDDTARLLARHIIETRPASDAEEAIANQDEWVLKPSSGGRGVDVRIGHETPREEWASRLREHGHADALQRFIPQKRFTIRHLDGEELRDSEMYVVGLLPCFEEHVFGPGIFRAGTGSVINVHQQRGEVLPCMVRG